MPDFSKLFKLKQVASPDERLNEILEEKRNNSFARREVLEVHGTNYFRKMVEDIRADTERFIDTLGEPEGRDDITLGMVKGLRLILKRIQSDYAEAQGEDDAESE